MKNSISPQTTEESRNQPADALKELRNALSEIITPVINSLWDSLKPFAEDFLSFEWAGKYHPEWLQIYYRTKKKRIRKKYRDRISREYKKWRNRNA